MDSLVLPAFAKTSVKSFNPPFQFTVEIFAGANKIVHGLIMTDSHTPFVVTAAIKKLPPGPSKRHCHEEDKTVPGAEEEHRQRA